MVSHFTLCTLLVLATATATFATPVRNSSTLIVGGEEADIGEFPWIVVLRYTGYHICAGSIVNAHWIVTAAHCTQYDVTSYTLVAGDHDISSADGTEQIRTVERIVNHPNYRPGAFENDISLIKVSEPLTINKRVQPVALPPSGFDPTKDTVAVGWGATSEGGPTSDVLMKVTVPHVTHELCRNAYGASRIADSMICAGVLGQGGKDACQGDSGGPLMCNTGSTNFLCGITSWGSGCARPNYPGVYTQTSYFTEWANQVVGTS